MPERETSSGAAVGWDPVRYELFARERAQPFHDLIARIPDCRVLAAADLGCGTGALSRLLLQRWPDAELWGVDHSAAMLARATQDPLEPRLHFVQADLATWRAPRPLDCIVSNAALHWVSGHAQVLAQLAEQLSSRGILAVQVPNNRTEPAYLVARDVLFGSRWGARVPADVLDVTVEQPDWYADHLDRLGFTASVWETIYYHQLASPAAIVDWLAGTTLRPALSLLEASERAELLESIAAHLAGHYAQHDFGVLFPFRRLFFVAVKRLPARVA